MRRTGDPDDTVVIRTRRRLLLPVVLACCLAFSVAAILVLGARSHAAGLTYADEAEILAAPGDTLHLYRFALAPEILVAVFPSLHAQARALNRAAVFLELAGAAHDRVPDDDSMAREIGAAGKDADHFYYGHDYRLTDLDRLWRLEDAQGLAVNREEQDFRAKLAEARAQPEGAAAVISVPPPGDGLQDVPGRRAILRHELSHGLYFTNAAYRRTVELFWQNVLSPEQRAGFRRMLGRDGYDTGNEDLVIDETQAYLVHTPDARYFLPRRAGIADEEAVRLRRTFVAAMPEGWLKARE